MGRLPMRARLYLVAVLACAAVVLLKANPLSNVPRWDSMLVAAVVGVLMILANTHMIELSHSTKLSVSTALEFGLLLIVGPALAIWTIAVCVALGAQWHLRHAWKWYSIALYGANCVISIAAAGAVYRQASGGISLLATPFSVLAVVPAALTYFLLNVGVVATMVALAKNSDSLSGFFSSFQRVAPEFGALLALGVVAAAVYEASPIAATLLLFPLLGVYASLRTTHSLKKETKQALEALALEVDRYHPYTAKHSERVAYYSSQIARRLRRSDEQIETITRAARIHDLGKLSIWKGMLNKPASLNQQELLEVHTHPSRGAELVSRFPDYRNGRDLILHHHERYDGKGYPDGLKGDQIPLGARIIAVADAVDAMLSDRSYRKALTIAETMKELERNSGKQFDPALVDVMLAILDAEARPQAWQETSQAAAMV